MVAGLRALASSQKRKKTALLRDVIEDVEAALHAGVKREVVLQELSRNGLEMKLSAFDSAVRRSRLQSAKLGSSNPTVAASSLPRLAHTSAIPKSNEPPPASFGSRDPADVDQIIGSTPDLNALAKFAKSGRK